MRKIFLIFSILMLCLFLCPHTVFAPTYIDGEYAFYAKEIKTDVSQFDGQLSPTDTDTQEALDTLDDRQATETTDDVQVDSLGVGTAASGTPGEIDAGDVLIDSLNIKDTSHQISCSAGPYYGSIDYDSVSRLWSLYRYSTPSHYLTDLSISSLYPAEDVVMSPDSWMGYATWRARIVFDDAGSDTATYYFNSYDTEMDYWDTNPGNMVDGDENVYASTSDPWPPEPQELDGNTCIGTDLGAIIKVEARVKHYESGDSSSRSFQCVISDEGWDADTILFVEQDTGAWTDWIDITHMDDYIEGSWYDKPSWSWADVQNLSCSVNAMNLVTHTFYISKVEIRVTHTTSPETISINDCDVNIEQDLIVTGDAKAASFTTGAYTLTIDETESLTSYLTSTRADTWLGTKDTDDLSEGTNLYWTNARGDARYLYKENTDPFTPDGDYEPATKKFVLDNAGTGDVTGPGSSVDNEIARFHETTGKIIQASSDGPTISDIGQIGFTGTGIPKKRVYISATAGIPRTTNACADAALSETTTNKINYYTCDFDADTDEFWQAHFTLPENYVDESTFTVAISWTCTADASKGVAWFVQLMSIANDDALDTAFGTAVEINDDGTTTGDYLLTAESAAITASGTPAGGDEFWIQVYRDADDADDDLTTDGKFIGIWLIFGVDALSTED